MPESTQAKLVTTPEDLLELATLLASQPIIAVDTESNSLHAYQEQVCLIQFSIPEGDFLVDPLAIVDLSPLASIFANPDIEKIFHAAEYDLIVLQRDFDYHFANLFDTMVAARIASRKKFGLGSLLEEEFQVRAAKKYQRADWGRRPLTDEMLDYASLDTHYLIRLRNILKAQLEKTDRWDMAQEDFARMPDTISITDSAPNVNIWRIKGVRDLSPQEAATLHQLARYRDKEASRANVPLFKIIGDRTLTAIAALAPRSKAELSEIKGMTNGQIRRFGQDLLSAVKRGQNAEALIKPKGGNYDPAFSDRLEILRNWRKLIARKMEVESDVVLPRDLMENIARTNPQSVTEIEEILTSLPLRKNRYSSDIYDELNPSQRTQL